MTGYPRKIDQTRTENLQEKKICSIDSVTLHKGQHTGERPTEDKTVIKKKMVLQAMQVLDLEFDSHHQLTLFYSQYP